MRGWIGVYKSADPSKFEAKSADPTMVLQLSKFGSTNSSTMKSQSRIRIKLQAKSTIWAKILDKSANSCKKFARSKIRIIFSVKSDDPKTYSPTPIIYIYIWNHIELNIDYFIKLYWENINWVRFPIFHLYIFFIQTCFALSNNEEK
jgi:hypothetical protein